MFESSGNLAAQITTLLDVLRSLGGDGRYACLVDARKVHFESGEGDTGALRAFIEARAAALFRLPQSLAHESEEPGDDVFADWHEPDGFFLAFINRRVAAVVACPEPEELPEQALKPLKALTERVFQWNPSYRSDGGRLSLFFNRPRLDLVVVDPPASNRVDAA
jgi:hypothetical protein